MKIQVLNKKYGLNSFLSDEDKEKFKERLIMEIYEVFKNEDNRVFLKLLNKALEYNPKVVDDIEYLEIDGEKFIVLKSDKSCRTIWSYLEYYKRLYRSNMMRSKKVNIDNCLPLMDYYNKEAV